MKSLSVTEFVEAMQALRDSAAVSVSDLIERHALELGALNERHERELEQMRVSMNDLGVTVPSNIPINLRFGERLFERIARIMGETEKPMNAKELKEILSAEGCETSIATIYVTLSTNRQNAWYRVNRGSYALASAKPQKKRENKMSSLLRKGRKKEDLFPHSYPQPLSSMILLAAEDAPRGTTVTKSSVRDYIENKFKIAPNMDSITSTLYMMANGGRLKKVGPGEFTVGLGHKKVT